MVLVYSAQSSAPWFHSWYKPKRRINRKIIPVTIQDWILEISMIDARGSNSVISTSKIKKITAIKKNRNENGRRAVPFGSKPHSKGEFFSRSEIVFFDSKEAIAITIVEIAKIIIIADDKIIIVFSKDFLSPGGWKPPILLY